MINLTKPKRRVEKIFIHCSAYPHQDLIGGSFRKAVFEWHKERGFSDIGYHGLIDCKGNFILGRNVEDIPAAQRGHNSLSLAFCLDGLYPEQFNNDQFHTLNKLANRLDSFYGDSITYHGHCEVDPSKTCPVFDYVNVLGLDESGYRNKNNINININPITIDEILNNKNINFKTERTLSKTSFGKDVRWIQQKLHIKADGVFGSETEKAIKTFQQSVGIETDGIVGPITWRFLFESFGKPY